VTLPKGAATFFSLGVRSRPNESAMPPWTHLRDQWEFSHLIRAGLGLVSLLLVTAIAL